MITSTFWSAATSVSAAIGSAASRASAAQRVRRAWRGRAARAGGAAATRAPIAVTRDRGQRAEVGAGDVEPGGDEHERQDEPAERLEEDAEPDLAVGAGRLQQPALEAQQQPQRAGDGHGGRRPLLVDVDHVGERLAREHRHDGDHRQRDEDVPAPARERARQLAAAAEPAQRRPRAPRRPAARRRGRTGSR